MEIGPEVYDYTDVDLDIDFPSIRKQPSNEGFISRSNMEGRSREPTIDQVLDQVIDNKEIDPGQ